MNIPDSEKKFLADFKFTIPVLADWKQALFGQSGFFIENGHITRLDLRGLNLTKLPNSIGSLKELRELLLGSNHLKILPESFRNLTNLEELGLGENKFHTLPDWFGNLKNLRSLTLGTNHFHALPKIIEKLENLEQFQLGENKFHTLPDWFGNLKNLRSLTLYGSKLHSLPETIGNLENLDWVELGSNKISVLPESFRSLKKLAYLGLENTGLRSFSNIPKELIDRIDPFEDSWPWSCFTQGNYPSKQAKRIIDYDLYDFWNYYRVSPLELAAKYAKDQDSLSPEEKDRLAWEGGFRERKLIEVGGVKPNDPILAEINKYLSISSSNGLKLIK